MNLEIEDQKMKVKIDEIKKIINSDIVIRKLIDVKDEHLHFEIRTVKYCGKGLGGRISPYNVYKKCPLKTPVVQSSQPSENDHNSYSILAILENLS